MKRQFATSHQRAILDQPFGQQNRDEFEWLCQFVRGVGSILEIGSCFGQSVRMLAFAAQGKARIRCIDLGVTDFGTDERVEIDTGAGLLRVIAGLRDCGIDAEVLLSDSHRIVAEDWAKNHGPYDFVLIDGDHSYGGAKQDWLDYGPMGKVVAFHDIASSDLGVGKLWAELKAFGLRTQENIQSPMGFGVVFND